MTNDTFKRFHTAYWKIVHSLDTSRLRAWEEHKLSLPLLRILFYIRSHPMCTANQIAKVLGLTPPTVSELVDKLVQRGFICRGEDPNDRRVTPLTLSESAVVLTGEISRENTAYLRNVASAIGPDIESVTADLELVAAAIESYAVELEQKPQEPS